MAISSRRRRLGELLVDSGLISQKQLTSALAQQRTWGDRLGTTLVEMGFVTESSLCELLADQLHLPSLDLDALRFSPDIGSLLRVDLCEHYGVFPLALDRPAQTLSIATADPTNFEHFEALEAALNLKVKPTVATASAIERAIRKYYFNDAVYPDALAPALDPQGEDAMLSPPENLIDTMTGEPVSIPTTEAEPQTEILALQRKVVSLEELNSAQVQALRVLLEILIESGLVTREEYLEKLHAAQNTVERDV